MLVLLAFLLLPVCFAFTLRHDSVTQGQVSAGVWPLMHRIPFRILRTPRGGHQLIFPGPARPPAPANPRNMKSALVILGTLLRTDHARKLLLGGTQLIQFTLQLHLSLSDAAHTAMAVGAVQQLFRLLPRRFRRRARLSVQPDFLMHRSCWQGQCIVVIPLGILIITGGMLLTAYLMERREHRPVSKEA